MTCTENERAEMKRATQITETVCEISRTQRQTFEHCITNIVKNTLILDSMSAQVTCPTLHICGLASHLHPRKVTCTHENSSALTNHLHLQICGTRFVTTSCGWPVIQLSFNCNNKFQVPWLETKALWISMQETKPKEVAISLRWRRSMKTESVCIHCQKHIIESRLGGESCVTESRLWLDNMFFFS